MEPIQRILRNAVDWCAPTLRRAGEPDCVQVTEPLERELDRVQVTEPLEQETDRVRELESRKQ